ncbi:unnamed protein product [Rotaria socialis]|uniref:Uncharacterized protein n=1 Tax=Rotaria socialis TaxID=392032 RepID=A0A818S0Q1_9BILA|nr:unnamed protein product [Rotaria socialis]CAF4611900.1 unnamed protein product [Rotaria socialis]
MDIQLKNSTSPLNDLATTYFKIGYINNCMKDYKNAKIHYEKALEFASPNNFIDQKEILHNRLFIIKKALEIISDDYCLVAVICYNIATIHDDKTDYKRVLEFYEMAFNHVPKIDEEVNDLLVKIYNNMTRIYKTRFNYQQVIHYWKKSIGNRIKL